MNENVGASFGLSVLVVLCFAVALYQPDRPPGKSHTAKPAGPPLKSVTAAKKTPAYVATEPKPSPPSKTLRPVSYPVVGVSPTVAETTLPVPRGAFTAARAGERLEDVARRVYGIKGSAERLWKANRDLIDNAEVELRTGMLVRTP